MRRISKIAFSSIMLALLFSVSTTAQETPGYFPPLPQGSPNMGSIQPFDASEVQRNIGIVDWHNGGYFGEGTRIGILDQGFAGVTELIERRAAQIRVEPDSTVQVYTTSSIRHGTDVAEVILIVAPHADLFLCKYNDFNAYVRCINWMLASDVKIITHSAGVPSLPLDGSNIWARQVDRAQSEGVLWINAAGNFNQGFIRDTFTDTNINTYHEFRGQGIVEAMTVTASQSGGFSRIMLSWEGNNTRSANTIDLDLYVVNAAGEVIASSTQVQAGGSNDVPLEIVQVARNQDIGIRVRDLSGSGELIQFVLFIEFAAIQEAESGGSVIAPADSLSALTVGALQGNQVAPYSSRGPLVSGAVKPDLIAPGEITLEDGRHFIGTSAAAPLVAGVAALIWEQNPQWQPAQVRSFLLNEAQDDTEIPGPDNDHGNGYLYIPSPNVVTSRGEEREAAITQVSVAFPNLPSGLVTSNAEWAIDVQNVNGIEMVFVPPGCFIMGSAFGRPNELPAHPQCFNRPFLIDRYEVTNADYGSAWPERWGQPNRPRVVVDFDEAIEHCRSRGARLPTEAEWEYAARGPDGPDYPWGDSFSSMGGIYGLNSGAQTAPVGSLPDGKTWVGAFDMSGNVYEWTSSFALPYPYDSTHEIPNETTIQHVLRGGSWITNEDALRTSFRVFVDPDFKYNTTGFRCAMSLENYAPVELPTNVIPSVPLAASEDTVFATFSTGVNLRAGPGTDYAAVGSANTEMQLVVVGQAQVNGETWYAVKDLDGVEKWAYGPFLQLNPPDSVVPVHRARPSLPTNADAVQSESGG